MNMNIHLKELSKRSGSDEHLSMQTSNDSPLQYIERLFRPIIDVCFPAVAQQHSFSTEMNVFNVSLLDSIGTANVTVVDG